WQKTHTVYHLFSQTLFPSAVECLHAYSCLERLLTALRKLAGNRLQTRFTCQIHAC
uniref:Uncharacterized protein n=1 Tax=Cynoglossus semilaevis TaxID=244447 RepID=A0A3P8V9W7_CYNSE